MFELNFVNFEKSNGLLEFHLANHMKTNFLEEFNFCSFQKSRCLIFFLTQNSVEVALSKRMTFLQKNNSYLKYREQPVDQHFKVAFAIR